MISVRPFPSGTGVPNSMVFRQQVVKRSSSSSKTGWTVPVLSGCAMCTTPLSSSPQNREASPTAPDAVATNPPTQPSPT
ncbi:hypothetical protein Ae717Ps2_6108 [Pseudonocardia sp. Ae717_Ps2]|nr:hypothetical protein Ae717Ps2_6108 [Pseudonocardia sp. Ae717_Ps2]